MRGGNARELRSQGKSGDVVRGIFGCLFVYLFLAFLQSLKIHAYFISFLLYAFIKTLHYDSNTTHSTPPDLMHFHVIAIWTIKKKYLANN